MSELKKPEEVAKEILNEIRQFDDYEYRLEEVEKAIKSDRSRLVQYIREKIRAKELDPIMDQKKSGLCEYEIDGWNSAIEAVERLLGEVR